MKKLLGSMLRLGTGEAIARLSTFALYAYISRVYGVELLGIVALAQTVAIYVTMGTDQGLRLIGARLVAKEPAAAPVIVRCVLRRRIVCCAICVGLACLYALWGPVPQSARLYVLGFALAVIPYSFSMDWLAWGLNRLGWLGAWRAIVSLTFVSGAILALHFGGSTLLSLTLSNAMSAIAGTVLLFALWTWNWRFEIENPSAANHSISEQLRWSAVLPLGMATILTLVFNNFDTVMLGAMSSVEELGRYSATYKILFMIFGVYYLLTQALYPKLSSMRAGRQMRRRFIVALFGLCSVGISLSLFLSFWAPSFLRLLYGSDLHAAHILRILSIAVPMDFCAAFVGIVLVSRGFDRAVLRAAGSAAAGNILANLWLIPKMGAIGAAWSTLFSYGILLGCLAYSVVSKPLFAEEAIRAVPSDPINSLA